MTSGITFVSMFHVFDNDRNSGNIENFFKIAELGINIVLYTETRFKYLLEPYLENTQSKNIIVLDCIDLQDTFIYDICNKLGYSLPRYVNSEKDTDDFLMMGHTKVELVRDAIISNVWNSSHFAWINFDILDLFDDGESLNYLREMAQTQFINTVDTLSIPGCLDKVDKDAPLESLKESICWRFLEVFLFGNIDSWLQFHNIYREKFTEFIEITGTLTWDVNFWCWLEKMEYFTPLWYKANHNDTVLHLPMELFATSLKDTKSFQIRPNTYPTIINESDIEYNHSSACYIVYNGHSILNTRAVSYRYLDGGLIFSISGGKIRNKNVLSTVSDDTLENLSFTMMKDDDIPFVSNDGYSEGLEDIRLYEFQGKLRFVATTVNYVSDSFDGRSRIMNGDYDIETHSYENCKLIQPPYDTFCEKNWIPLLERKDDNRELFVYQWNPFEIGCIDHTTNKLEIVKSVSLKGSYLKRYRGSSTFIKAGDNSCIAVIHMSSGEVPPKYFHNLVQINTLTLTIEKLSRPFYFQTIGIEYCIGFTRKDDRYHFWISQLDRDPSLVSIECHEIPLIPYVV